MALDVGSVYGRLGAQFDGRGFNRFDAAMLGAVRNATAMESAMSRVARTTGRVAMTLGKTLLIGAGVATAGVAALGIAAGVVGGKFFNMREQAQIAFTTMLKSGSKAKVFLDQLQAFANKTPFEFPDLVTASERLLAMGFKAKEVIPTLTSIGDAVSALGGGSEKINQVTLALGQMRLKGKVQAEEMLQLTEAGINGWGYLAKALNTNVAGAMDLVHRKQVDAGMATRVIAAGMERDFGGMMAKQSQTLAGLWSTTKDVFSSLAGTVFAPFFTEVEHGLASVNQWLGSKDAQAWGDRLAAGMSVAIGKLGELASFAAAHWPEVKAAGMSAFNGIKGVIVEMTPTALHLFNAVKEAALGVAPIAKAVFQGIAGAIQVVAPVIDTVASGFHRIVDAIGGAAIAGAVATFYGLTRAILGVVGAIGAMALAGGAGGVGGVLAAMVNPITAIAAIGGLAAGALIYLASSSSDLGDKAASAASSLHDLNNALLEQTGAAINQKAANLDYARAVITAAQAHRTEAAAVVAVNAATDKYGSSSKQARAAREALTTASLNAKQADLGVESAALRVKQAGQGRAEADAKAAKAQDDLANKVANVAAEASKQATVFTGRVAGAHGGFRKGTDDARGAAQRFSAALIDQAKNASGLSTQERVALVQTANLATTLGRIPTKKETVLTVTGNAFPMSQSVLDNISRIQDKTVRINVITAASTINPQGAHGGKRPPATGGVVAGYYSAGDRVPTHLSGEEVVVNPRQRRAIERIAGIPGLVAGTVMSMGGRVIGSDGLGLKSGGIGKLLAAALRLKGKIAHDATKASDLERTYGITDRKQGLTSEDLNTRAGRKARANELRTLLGFKVSEVGVLLDQQKLVHQESGKEGKLDKALEHEIKRLKAAIKGEKNANRKSALQSRLSSAEGQLSDSKQRKQDLAQLRHDLPFVLKDLGTDQAELRQRILNVEKYGQDTVTADAPAPSPFDVTVLEKPFEDELALIDAGKLTGVTREQVLQQELDALNAAFAKSKIADDRVAIAREITRVTSELEKGATTAATAQLTPEAQAALDAQIIRARGGAIELALGAAVAAGGLGGDVQAGGRGGVVVHQNFDFLVAPTDPGQLAAVGAAAVAGFALQGGAGHSTQGIG